ncbi:MAG: hypothetical protein ABIP79_09365 [Chitinophagaceae bacterium]
MGLSIHYSGRLKDERKIDELIEEISDICKSLQWHYTIIREPIGDKLNGVCFSPAKSEPICFTFLPGGRLCSPLNLMNKEIYDSDQLDKELLYTASTKTQYAGMDAHVAIIKLLRYLREKYFEEFELMDEGYYWETNDLNKLNDQFSRYEFAINTFTEALSNMPKLTGESASSIADRIEEMLKKKFDNNMDEQEDI